MNSESGNDMIGESIVLVFPHQLFREHPLISDNESSIVLIEDSLLFGDSHTPAAFHRKKLMLHRASMRAYARRLREAGRSVTYIEYGEGGYLGDAMRMLHERGVRSVLVLDPVDYLMERRLRRYADSLDIALHLYPTPNFLNTREQNREFFDGAGSYFMAEFYKEQRRRLGVLLEDNGEPVGGSWSFDRDNRRKLPKRLLGSLPQLPTDFPESPDVVEARAYVLAGFPDNPGSTDSFFYPIDHRSAETWLETFLRERFDAFGPYEDALEPNESLIYHSMLTPALNIGLLTPRQVIDRALDVAGERDVPLQSVEGFVRQVIGWREFMRAAYDDLGVAMRTSNEWGHDRPMPKAFYTGETGIDPIDDTIRRVLEHGWCHHIERLMILGGFMFLCRIDPTHVFRWFSELFVDAYDWVMVPNVYGMSQNADGGLITTKPYFSGSNYVRTMSHYPVGDWCDVWDGLYWTFIFDNMERLQRNHRWSMMVASARRMSSEKIESHRTHAARFLSRLFE